MQKVSLAQSLPFSLTSMFRRQFTEFDAGEFSYLNEDDSPTELSYLSPHRGRARSRSPPRQRRARSLSPMPLLDCGSPSSHVSTSLVGDPHSPWSSGGGHHRQRPPSSYRSGDQPPPVNPGRARSTSPIPPPDYDSTSPYSSSSYGSTSLTYDPPSLWSSPSQSLIGAHHRHEPSRPRDHHRQGPPPPLAFASLVPRALHHPTSKWSSPSRPREIAPRVQCRQVECTASFSLRSNESRHFREKHQQRGFKCQFCDQMCKSRRTAESHMRKCQGSRGEADIAAFNESIQQLDSNAVLHSSATQVDMKTTAELDSFIVHLSTVPSSHLESTIRQKSSMKESGIKSTKTCLLFIFNVMRSISFYLFLSFSLFVPSLFLSSFFI
jgi:hypothetical protein